MAEYYVGEIRVFAGDYAPAPDWHLCDGSLLSISQYNLLYSVIGTIYGGDGRSTFAIPDLRGRLAVHRVQSAAQGAQFSLGNTGGTETVTLQTPQIPAHTHDFMASTNQATTPTPGYTVGLGNSNPPPWQQYTSAQGQIQVAPMSPKALSIAGGSQPHANIMPGETINYIIALNGLFPTPVN